MAFFRYSTLTRELLEISDIPISPGDNEAISEIDAGNLNRKAYTVGLFG